MTNIYSKKCGDESLKQISKQNRYIVTIVKTND